MPVVSRLAVGAPMRSEEVPWTLGRECRFVRTHRPASDAAVPGYDPARGSRGGARGRVGHSKVMQGLPALAGVNSTGATQRQRQPFLNARSDHVPLIISFQLTYLGIRYG